MGPPEEDRGRLREALERLPNREASIVSMRLRGRRLGEVAAILGLDPNEAAKAHRSAMRRLGSAVEMVPRISAPPSTIPATEMDDLYAQVAANAAARGGESLQRYQLALARQWLQAPEQLGEAFARSIHRFAAYDNRWEPFYPRGRDVELKARLAHERLEGTNDVAAWLIDGALERGHPRDASFAYVDREVWPARTTGGARFSDGRSARQAPRMDLLLTAVGDRTPIVGEVKVRSDQHPLYALIQLLMLAVQTATPAQIERLREWYPGSFNETTRRVELLILLAGNPDHGRYRPALFDAAEQLSGALLGQKIVARHIRRIACVDVRLDAQCLLLSTRFDVFAPT